MKIHRPTAAALGAFVLVIVGLATWGHHLGMSADALRWVQGASALIGVAAMAALPRLLADRNRDGIPDIVERQPRRPRSTDVPPALAVLLAAGLAAHATGCGASPETRAAYAAETERCIANERAIVDRTGTTEAQDREDLATERARCDAARAAIGGAP